MGAWDGVWLAGERGLFVSDDAREWRRLGPYEYPIKGVLRQEDRLVLAAEWGLWEVRPGAGRPGEEYWTQLHDETLTEVLALAVDQGDPGVAAASPYGVALGVRQESGAVRWRSLTEGLAPDRRYSNALAAGPGAGEWLVGNEAGVLLVDAGGAVREADLPATPVRALLRHDGLYWAGSDAAGVWCSEDGLRWRRHGAWSWGAVFCLAVADGRLLAGSEAGVVRAEADGGWMRCGPRTLAAALAAQPGGAWLMGASPGGLWRSDDAGETWEQTGQLRNVRLVLAPEGA